MTVNSRNLGTKWLVLALIAAVTSLTVFFAANPVWGDNYEPIMYAENGTGPVATFNSEDADGDTITWATSDSTAPDAVIRDGARFEFSDDNPGELNFVTSPDYEMPRGAVLSDSNPNTYKIVVTANDGSGTPTATNSKEVVIEVTDVEERATIELSTRLPVVGQELTATLKNDDEVASGVRWTWERKDGANWVDVEGTIGAPTTIPNHSNTYTPVQSEIGAELRVGTQYIDTDDDNQTIAAVAFEHAVAPSASGANVAPTFAEGTTTSRSVKENSPAGTAVGKPVTATDDHRAASALSYMLAQTSPSLAAREKSQFRIEPKTGQIRVNDGAKLNYDPVGDTAAVNSYILTVTVDDPDGGDAGTISVTVNVTDVAEAPKVTGPAMKKVDEDFDSDPDTDGRQLVVDEYTGTDEAGAATGLTLEGADAAAFGLTRNTDGRYSLAFNEAPDFEKPGDTGANNEYQVTVVATDRGLRATRNVVVRVENAKETGEIELKPAAPTVGKAVKAELDDEDGVQANTVTWVWSSKDDTTCDATTTFARGDRVAGATSDTYTPTAAECLRVTARYTDGKGMDVASTEVTVGARTSNVPVFDEDDPIIRSVNENATTVPTDVGSVADPGTAAPVVATDVDTSATPPDTLTYTIVSVDPSSGAARFSIDNTGQLKAEEKLDHEEQASYVLEVKATDSTGNSATVMVTVMVNNVNDKPGAIMDSRRNNNYAENGTGPVATFNSEDADGDTITWATSDSTAPDAVIRDGARFEFSDDNPGELNFVTSPDYEMPRGAVLSDSNPNTYKIVVTANDGSGTPTATNTKEVVIEVTDVEERATIELSTRLPVVGQSLTATLKNDDEVASGVRWTWSGIEGTPTDTTEPYVSTYTPIAGDGNDRVRVGVKYIDTDGQDQTIAAVAFEHAVAPSLAPDVTSESPTFAEGTTTSRSVKENSPAGTAVGKPVTATDDHRAASALSYMLAQTSPSLAAGEKSQFRIEPKTGQIRVNDGAKLNYDPVGDTAAVNSYILTVTVDDPDGGDAGTISVTVNVTDVAEAPKVTGPAMKKVDEDFDSDPDTDGRQLVVDEYTGTDEAGAATGLTLEGADAAAFGLTRNTDGRYSLAFNEAPDFEKPGDTGANNEYQVTVVATDRGLRATRNVVVRVENAKETGEIELKPAAPTVGKAVKAELDDEDGVQANTVTWVWSSKDDTTCDATTTFARGDRVAGATSDTYTPTAAECLRVTARYTDGKGMDVASTEVTVGARTSNVPVFDEDDPIIRSVNENATTVPTDVGSVADPGTAAPVVATDVDTSATPPDTLTYTIVSVDPSSGAARFSIDNTGQLKAEEKLDHEEQASYVLEVKATDSTGNSATVMVTVMVNNVNDKPGAIMVSTSPLNIGGRASVSYAEDRTDAVGTYTAAGPNKDMARWSLEGDDAGDFRVEGSGASVMLKFRSSPNHEAPADADTDNTYMVTLKATDGENMDTHEVTVMVTNVDEDGTVTLSTDRPAVDTAITATLADPDGSVSGESWQWSSSDAMDGNFTDIDGATGASYTPVEADDGKYLKVMVTYTDGEGSGKSAMETAANAVTAGDPLLAKYDKNPQNGKIDRDEVLDAIDGFFASPRTATREEVLDLIDLFFEGLRS